MITLNKRNILKKRTNRLGRKERESERKEAGIIIFDNVLYVDYKFS